MGILCWGSRFSKVGIEQFVEPERNQIVSHSQDLNADTMRPARLTAM
jgi:hypothetical protein